MATWINKLKQLLIGFLGTHDNKYIITDKGLKIIIFDRSFLQSLKTATSFSSKSKNITSFTNKDINSTSFTNKNKHSSIWSNINKS